MRWRLLAGAMLVGGLSLSGLQPASGAMPFANRCQDRSLEKARAIESVLRDRVEAHPGTAEAWARLAQWLRGRPDRARALAGYHAGLDWQVQEAMDPAFFDTLDDELRQILEQWRRATPEDPGSWCALARAQSGGDARVAISAAAISTLPASPTVARCHLDALVENGEAAAAVAFGRGFRDSHPEDPESHRLWINLIKRMRLHVGASRGVLERYQEPAKVESILRQAEAAPSIGMLTEAYVRYAREIDSVTAHLALADHEAEFGLGGRAARRLEGLASRPLDAAERAELCHGLTPHLDLFPESSLASCWRRVAWARGTEALGQANRAAIMAAEDELFTLAFEAADWYEVDRQLATLEPVVRMTRWTDHWFDDAASCMKFRQDLESGWLAAGTGGVLARNAEHAAAMLGRCGYQADADAWSSTGREARRAEAELIAQTVVIVTPVPEHEDFYRRQAERDSDDARPLDALFSIARQTNDVGAALALVGDAISRGPRGLDLVLRIAAFALEAGRDEAVLEAVRVAEVVADKSPRQGAEIAYLKARIARRRGDLESATEGFDSYYSLRFKFEGCCSVLSCDRSFVLHLIEVGDFTRLDDYLDRRRVALDYFAAEVAPLASTASMTYDAKPCAQRSFLPPLLAMIDSGCVPVSTVPYLEGLVAGSPDNHAFRDRLAEARRRPVCQQPVQPETHFRDNRMFDRTSAEGC